MSFVLRPSILFFLGTAVFSPLLLSQPPAPQATPAQSAQPPLTPEQLVQLLQLIQQRQAAPPEKTIETPPQGQKAVPVKPCPAQLPSQRRLTAWERMRAKIYTQTGGTFDINDIAPASDCAPSTTPIPQPVKK